MTGSITNDLAAMAPASADAVARAAETHRLWCEITGQDDGGLAALLALVAEQGIPSAMLTKAADVVEWASAGHVAEIDDAGVIVHQGVGVSSHNVPRRLARESLSWDGTAWQMPGYGVAEGIAEGDVAGAQSWAAEEIQGWTRLLPHGLVRLAQMPDGAAERYARPAVTGWKHHRDDHGQWWEPVVR